MSDGTKPLSEQILSYPKVFCGVHLKPIPQQVLMNLIINLKVLF